MIRGQKQHPPQQQVEDITQTQEQGRVREYTRSRFSDLLNETSKYDISNQDTADWLGDTLFTCLDVTSGHTESDQYSTISLFEVEVDTRWGAYSLCNGYPVRPR